MNENKNEQVIPAQVPQIIYGYPSQISREDEIDLGELLVKLMKQTKLMLAIVIVGTLLSVVVALLLPNIYQQEVILATPKKSDIVDLNANGYAKHTPLSIFKEYYEYLRSAEKLNNFINSNNLLEKLYPESTFSPNRLIEEFEKKLVISVLEPVLDIKGGIVTFPERISMTAEGEEESEIVNFLNQYVQHIEGQLIQDLILEQKTQIESELENIDRDIIYKRNNTKKSRLREITRLEDKNKEKIADLNSQLNALVEKAKADKKSQILVLQEAFEIAKNMKIIKPTTLSDLSRSGNEGNGKTEITFSDEKEFPLYLMGTDFVQAKIDELKKRKDDLPFIDQYRSLKQAINLVENDAALKALKDRKNDDPYISELPELLQKKQKLEGLSLNFENTKVARVERYAKVTGKKIKPKRSLVVLSGGVLSVMLALFVGTIFAVVKNRSD